MEYAYRISGFLSGERRQTKRVLLFFNIEYNKL